MFVFWFFLYLCYFFFCR